MLCCLLTFQGDLTATQNLLTWVGELGGCPGHDLVLVADADTSYDGIILALETARKSFRSAKVITNEKSVMGWPAGSWSLFQTVVEHVREPFLLLEPDAVPLKAGWLDAIEAEYRACGQAFMGHIYQCQQPFLPGQLMSGVGCYPGNMRELLPPAPEPQAWDVYCAAIAVACGADTKLIRHFYGQRDLAPFFVRERHARSPVNALTLDVIPPECVLWHRDKTHALIRLLRGQGAEKITVCFPVHSGDIRLAVTHAAWLCKMGRKQQHKAVICHDPSCPVVPLNQLESHLRRVFTEVETFVYARPPIPGYPEAANWAFQSVALHMAKQKSPWFFFEADGIALKPDWLDQLQEEYETAGTSWMGPHVKGMRHANGCMIYPADAAMRMPTAMRCSSQAWDYSAASDYMHDCHDASRLLQHIWSIVDDNASEVGGGQVPANVTLDRARRWLQKEAVCVHRIKDDTLLRLLISGEFKP